MIVLVIPMLLSAQIVVTDVRRNTDAYPIDLAMNCSFSNGGQPDNALQVRFSGSAGAGPGVRVATLPNSNLAIRLVGDTDTVSLTNADDHTQNSMSHTFIARIDRKKYLVSLSIVYPRAMLTPTRYDNSIPFEKSEIKIEELKHFHRVDLGGTGIFVPNERKRVPFMRGTCVLADVSTGGVN